MQSPSVTALLLVLLTVILLVSLSPIDPMMLTKKEAGTEAIMLNGVPYRLEYTLTWAEAQRPNDHQKDGHGSCFLMASVVVRHQLQLLDNVTWAPGHLDIPKAMQELHNINPDFVKYPPGQPTKFTEGVPQEAFKAIVSSTATVLPIDDLSLPLIVAKAKLLPCMLPYLPTPASGPVVVMTPKELALGLHAEFVKGKNDRKLHSQAVVGIATNQETGKQYFCARQTWVGSKVTLVPIMTTDDIAAVWAKERRLVSREIKASLVRHHRVMFPTEDHIDDGIDSGPLSFSAGPATFSLKSSSSNLMTPSSV